MQSLSCLLYFSLKYCIIQVKFIFVFKKPTSFYLRWRFFIWEKPGAIGVLNIPSINLNNVRVNDAPDLLDYGSSPKIPSLTNGVGHYPNTPSWNGTVGLAGHNTSYFKNLHKLKVGSTILYTVNGVTRSYEVVKSEYVSDDSWGVFSQSNVNQLVLTTCEKGEFHGRLAVTARQVSDDTVTGTIVDETTPATRSRNTSNDIRYSNGHDGDTVDGNPPKTPDDYVDGGYNNHFSVFTGSW